MDEDDEYNDDFMDEDYSNAPSPDGRAGGSRQHHDDEDEQHTQKVSGKLETLQDEVAELRRALSAEKDKNDDAQKRIVELETAKSVGGSEGGAASAEEVAALRRKNEQLNTRLEEALSLSPDVCPPDLKDAFITLCKKKAIFPELKADRDFTVEACVRILRAETKAAGRTKAQAAPPGDSNSVVSADTASSKGGHTQSSSAVTNALHDRVRRLEKELRAAQYAVENVKTLKSKCVAYNERIRVEKETRYRCEDDIKTLQKKVEMLSTHMEKLVLHLKHEGAHKMRLAEQCRVAERQALATQEKCDLVARKSAAKDRLILELREGSKVLEDQLRLMDEKYLELRTKLDYARELGAKRIKKAEKAAADLRVRFIMAGNTSTVLDALPLPDIGSSGGSAGGSSGYYQQSQSLYSNDGDGGGGGDNHSWSSALMAPSPYGRDTGGGGRRGHSRQNKTIGFAPSNNQHGDPQRSAGPGRHSRGGGGGSGGGGGGMHRSGSVDSMGSRGSRGGGGSLGLPDPSLDSVMNKIRRQQQGKGAALEEGWSEGRARGLLGEDKYYGTSAVEKTRGLGGGAHKDKSKTTSR